MPAQTPHPGSIVAGVNGSECARRAVDWAADVAARRGLPLHLLHAANIDWLVAAALISSPDEHPMTDETLDAETRRVLQRHPGLRVTAELTTGAPAHDLVDVSARASMLVVGTQCRHAITQALGSVAQHVAARAHCAVVVVREGIPKATPAGAQGPADAEAASIAGPPVVVGVDGSAMSTAAVDFAFAHASLTGAPLVVLHAWWLEFAEGAVVTTESGPEGHRVLDGKRLTVSETLAGRGAQYPDVAVDVRLVHDRPEKALVAASANAALVVVGARGHGAVTGLLLGSVSQDVLLKASCPVAVVRPARARPNTHTSVATHQA